jgi:hypothetical protein
MINKEQTKKVLWRLFNGGVIRRIPKSQKDAKVFLALAASSFDPQVGYSEPEVNEHLLDWMDSITCPASIDHVTVRRYLVDFHFLLRDNKGTLYRTNQSAINLVIEPEARSIHPRYVLEEVSRAREQRKHAITT